MRVRLHRKVRFAINASSVPIPGADHTTNGYAARPPIVNLGQFVELEVRCSGTPDPTSGYLINITTIDQAVRKLILPLFAQSTRASSPVNLLNRAFELLTTRLPVTLDSLVLHQSPYHCIEMHTLPAGSSSSTSTSTLAQLRLGFDFAAAHRLHVPSWSDEQNRECFGKCNNPNGHGHNYRLEIAVNLPGCDSSNSSTLHLLPALEDIVKRVVLDRFDHTNLNLDTVEFNPQTGCIPSVENIAKVCYHLLKEPICQLAQGVSLAAVQVWETDRTSCQYPA